MSTTPQKKRTLKLWQLLLVIALVGIVLGLLPDQHVALAAFLCIETALLLGLFVLLVSDFVKRHRKP